MSNRLKGHPSNTPKNFYTTGLAHTATEVFVGRGGLYGYHIENKDAGAIYLRVYDAGEVGEATAGNLIWTTRVVAGTSSSGSRDPQNFPLFHVSRGCFVTASAAEGSDSAVTSDPTVTIWYHKLA